MGCQVCSQLQAPPMAHLMAPLLVLSDMEPLVNTAEQWCMEPLTLACEAISKVPIATATEE